MALRFQQIRHLQGFWVWGVVMFAPVLRSKAIYSCSYLFLLFLIVYEPATHTWQKFHVFLVPFTTEPLNYF